MERPEPGKDTWSLGVWREGENAQVGRGVGGKKCE